MDLKGLWVIHKDFRLHFSAAETNVQSELRQVLVAPPSVVIIIGLSQIKLFSLQLAELVLCILWFISTFNLRFSVWLTNW